VACNGISQGAQSSSIPRALIPPAALFVEAPAGMKKPGMEKPGMEKQCSKPDSKPISSESGETETALAWPETVRVVYVRRNRAFAP
jgi:hypothetical protein